MGGKWTGKRVKGIHEPDNQTNTWSLRCKWMICKRRHYPTPHQAPVSYFSLIPPLPLLSPLHFINWRWWVGVGEGERRQVGVPYSLWCVGVYVDCMVLHVEVADEVLLVPGKGLHVGDQVVVELTRGTQQPVRTPMLVHVGPVPRPGEVKKS